MKYLVLMLALFTLSECANNFYSFNGPDDPPPASYHALLLDSSYSLYVRKVNKVGPKGERDLETKQRSIRSDSQPLIEVEYLLVSDSLRNVIYISTLADKWQTYYQKNYLGDGYVNMWDFETILFGKMQDSHTFIFESKDKDHKTRIEWQWRRHGAEAVVVDLQEFLKDEFQLFIPAHQALKDSILFMRVASFNIVYHEKGLPLHQDIIPWKDRSIHIEENEGKYTVFFVLDSALANGDSLVKFLDNRIPFAPGALYSR
jgi:hypothetical protein